VSGARFIKVQNRLADSVDVRFGTALTDALQRADIAVRSNSGDMLENTRAWVGEIAVLCENPEPDLDRLNWLANGVLGIASACGMATLSRCGGLFVKAIAVMKDNWRKEIAEVYAKALTRLLEGEDSPEQEQTVLASLENMNKRLEGIDVAG
jgi:hypothetical protein